MAAKGKKQKTAKEAPQLVSGAEDAASKAVAGIEGHFDRIDEAGWAAGWARKPGSSAPVSLLVKIDDVVIGEVLADQFRPDLVVLEGTGGNCAFWFDVPEEYLDGEPHEIDIYSSDTGQHLIGCPQQFTVARLNQRESRDRHNSIANASFVEWPNGLVVQASKRFFELFPGWFFDYQKNTEPKVVVSADKPADAALKPAQYALKVVIEAGGTDGYMRLIAPLDASSKTILKQRFSLGIRRPYSALHEELHVSEIFIAKVRNSSIERISTIRRNVRPRGTQRILGISAVNQPELYAAVPDTESLALVIDIRGNGTLWLFSPELSAAAPNSELTSEIVGEFEDPNIRSQIDSLALSPIWRSGRRAALIQPHALPAVVPHATSLRGHSAVPFIQIVVPVFNAATDVEDLLRSIIHSTDSPYEILIFDDGSAEFTQLRISQWEALDSRVRYYRHRENVGYTRNINYALQSAVSDFVVLINSDTVVAPGWLRKMYQVLEKYPDTAAVGPLSNAASWQSIPRTKGAGGDWIVNEFPEHLTTDVIDSAVEKMFEGEYPEFPLLNGFCTMFRRSALQEIGFFDDASFPRGYGEENDLCLRLGLAGYVLRVAADTYVEHKKSKSFGNDQRKELSKNANAILRGKHPSVSFDMLEETMRTSPVVNRIREHLLQMMMVEKKAPVIPKDAPAPESHTSPGDEGVVVQRKAAGRAARKKQA